MVVTAAMSSANRHHSVSGDVRQPGPVGGGVATANAAAAAAAGVGGARQSCHSTGSSTVAKRKLQQHQSIGLGGGVHLAQSGAVPMLTCTPDSPALADLRLTLRAASMQTLVEQCVLCFGDEGDASETSALPLALFLVHKWYQSSAQFAGMLLQLCRARPALIPSVCRTVKRWIQLFPEHFDGDTELFSTIEEIRREAVEGKLFEYSSFLDTASIPSYAWMRNVSVRNPAARQFSLSFEMWTPDEIAVHMTHIEYKLLRRITFAEYKQYASTSQLNTAPTLKRSIAVFNSLSQWVQCMVLSKATAKERADIVTKFVRVAKRLRKLKNFNTFMAVVGGLTHSSLARLSKTFVCLSPETRRDLTESADLLASNGNFSAYRKAFDECRGFKIPIIGVHLKDLICLHSASNDYTSEGLMNCRKLAQLAIIFTHLMLDIQKPHNLPEANSDLIHTLKVSFDMRYSDDEIYALSLKREPRTLLNSFHRATVFADWASGVCSSLDPQIMQKHIIAMVDTVFKHYDHNKDGYISQAEFEAVAGNFPLIDSFPVLDTDRDGKISKDEMQLYFMRVSNSSRAADTRHNFRETTFLTPAFCCQCKRMLWGPLRQGMKCRDCGVAVHRHCRESVTGECVRRRPQRSLKLDRSSSFVLPSNVGESASGGDVAGAKSDANRDNDGVGCGGNVGWKAPVGKSSSFKRPFSTFLGRPRPQRAISSISPTGEPSPPTANLFPVGSKLRSWSESADYFRTPSPASEHVPSLASEEVFEIDESSVSPPVRTEEDSTTSARRTTSDDQNSAFAHSPIDYPR